MVKISVGIPVYNAAPYIKPAVESVLNQTFSEIEVIVTDDLSTDGTADIVKSIRDPRLRYECNQKRLGPPANFNRCLELSKGEYVSIFHADDVMEPENLKKKKQFLDSSPRLGFVHSRVSMIGPLGEPAKPHWYQHGRDEAVPGQRVFLELLRGANFITASSVLMRRECYEKLGGFETSLAHACDWEMWMRISLFYDIAYLSAPLVKYRQHEQMHSAAFYADISGEREYLKAKMHILRKYAGRIEDAGTLRREVREAALHTAALRASEAWKRKNISDFFQAAGFWLEKTLHE